MTTRSTAWILAVVVTITVIAALITTTPVRAATSADVTVIADPSWGGSGAPTNLILIQVSDFQVDASWTKGAPAAPAPIGTDHTVVNTMLRVKWGSAPADRTDGYQVYYGVASSFSDTSIDLTSLTGTPVYKAWTETVFYDIAGNIITSVWDTVGVSKEANFMSISWLFAVLGLLALGLSVALFFSKQAMLGFPCAIFWAIFGAYNYTLSTTTWDIYYLVFFSAFGMTIFTMFAAFALRTKKEEAEEGDLYFDEGGDNDVKFIDEGVSPSEANKRYDDYGNARPRYSKKKLGEEVVSDRVRGVRERAEARRKRFEH